MQNLLFFLWMMFFPLVDDIAEWVRLKNVTEKQNDKDGDTSAEFMCMVVYFVVGWLLYKK